MSREILSTIATQTNSNAYINVGTKGGGGGGYRNYCKLDGSWEANTAEDVERFDVEDVDSPSNLFWVGKGSWGHVKVLEHKVFV